MLMKDILTMLKNNTKSEKKLKTIWNRNLLHVKPVYLSSLYRSVQICKDRRYEQHHRIRYSTNLKTKVWRSDKLCFIPRDLRNYHPMVTHACRAASSFATFWLLPIPRPHSCPFTKHMINLPVQMDGRWLTAASHSPSRLMRLALLFGWICHCITFLHCCLVNKCQSHEIGLCNSIVRWATRGWICGKGRWSSSRLSWVLRWLLRWGLCLISGRLHGQRVHIRRFSCWVNQLGYPGLNCRHSIAYM